MKYNALVAIASSLLAIVVACAQSNTTSCGTSVTLTNVYGQNGQFYLFVNDPTQPTGKQTVIAQNFTVAASNGIMTIPLRVDQNGNPVSIRPGIQYTLTLETYGPGVCCGAFSNYTLALSGDLMFSDGTRTHSGFLAPGNFAGDTLQFSVDTSGTSCPVLVDPVSALTDPTQSNFINQTVATLASAGRPVAGIAADGASRVVLRIPANTLADQIYIQVMSDPNTPSTSTDDDGGLDVISGQNFASFVSSPLTVTQPNPNSKTYTAFALYRAPIDFVRASQPVPCTDTSSCDSAMSTRTVYIQVQNGQSTYVFPIDIVRPPVVLVHGLTADRTAWDNFTPFVLNPLFRIYVSNYGAPVCCVTDISPNYTAAYSGNTVSVLALPWVHVTGSELGFQYNANTVLQDIQNSIDNYKSSGPAAYPVTVASVQADIVAHSMGGLVTRMAARSGYDFFSWDNYYTGSVHKMITLGTPHLGSPNSLQSLDTANSENYCLMTLLATAKNILELQGAVVLGNYVTGGAYDLGGDGQGGSLSPALQSLQIPAYRPMSVAALAGTVNSEQYDNLSDATAALAARYMCLNKNLPYNPNSIPQNYTPTGWPILMANGNLAGAPSDGVVPLTSALNNSPSYTSTTAGSPDSVTALNTFEGVVHSPGVAAEGFGNPYLQQSGAGFPVSIQDRVLQLLNTSVSSNVFQVFP